MYCLKCKGETETTSQSQIMSKNNKLMLTGICSECGRKKCKFIKQNVGSGLFNTALSYLPELHLPASQGENVQNGSFNNLQKYSYCGPGTKYDQRVKEGYQGINELDRMCKLHDKFYNENKDTKNRNISDIALAHRAEEISKDLSFDPIQQRDAKLVSMIMKTKARFGLGISKKTKNLKKGLMKAK